MIDQKIAWNICRKVTFSFQFACQATQKDKNEFIKILLTRVLSCFWQAQQWDEMWLRIQTMKLFVSVSTINPSILSEEEVAVSN